MVPVQDSIQLDLGWDGTMGGRVAVGREVAARLGAMEIRGSEEPINLGRSTTGDLGSHLGDVQG
jgi:hypothetical protein